MSALSHTLFAALLLALLSSAPAANAADLKICPPKDFDSVSDFMIKAYVGNAAPRPWYIQEQARVCFLCPRRPPSCPSRPVQSAVVSAGAS